MILSPGSRIGRYDVRSFLGSGSMGEVYLAYDSELERDIAIKVLRDAEASRDRCLSTAFDETLGAVKQ
jgi:serine/threonine protein kinase